MDLPDRKTWIRTICTKNNLQVRDAQLDTLEFYSRLLLEWNKKINLISRKDEENFWTYHILHCISVLFLVDLPLNVRVADIGTGGGLPGIPLKILRPDLNIVCIDSTKKKIDAVSQMITEMKLDGIRAVWGRAEDLGFRPPNAHAFEYVTARAVASLSDIICWSEPFLILRNGRGTVFEEKGKIQAVPPAAIIFKGGDLDREIDDACRKYPGNNVRTLNLTFPGSEQLIASDKKILVVHF